MTATRPAPDTTWVQQTALLDTTLDTIIRKAAEMQADLRNGEIDLARADQLGHATLIVLKKAAVIADRVERTAKARRETAAREAVA